jgi:hypothetical protein
VNFNLTTACDNCPFRKGKGVALMSGRRREIVSTLLQDGTFACHKTTVPSKDDMGDRRCTSKSEHCAGALIAMYRMGRIGQLARIAGRLGVWDPAKLKLDDTDVYEDLGAFLAAKDGNSAEAKRRKAS